MPKKKMLSYLNTLNRLSYDGDGRSKFFGAVQGLNNIDSISKLVIVSDEQIGFGTTQTGDKLPDSTIECAFINGNMTDGEIISYWGAPFGEIEATAFRIEVINSINFQDLNDPESKKAVMSTTYLETADGTKSTNSSLVMSKGFIGENILLFIPGYIDKVHIYYE